MHLVATEADEGGFTDVIQDTVAIARRLEVTAWTSVVAVSVVTEWRLDSSHYLQLSQLTINNNTKACNRISHLDDSISESNRPAIYLH